MPISVSAKKALRVARAKTLVNQRRKAILKAALKTASEATLAKTFSVIDKSAKWGIIEPNKASRLKSRLSKEFPNSSTPRPKAATKSPSETKKAPTAKAKTSTKTAKKAK